MSVLPPSALYPPSLPKCRWGWLANLPPPPPSLHIHPGCGWLCSEDPSALYPPSLPKCSNSLTHSLSITRTWVFLYLHTHVRNKVFWAKAFFWKECIYHETKLCIHHPRGLGHEYVRSSSTSNGIQRCFYFYFSLLVACLFPWARDE